MRTIVQVTEMIGNVIDPVVLGELHAISNDIHKMVVEGTSAVYAKNAFHIMQESLLKMENQ